MAWEDLIGKKVKLISLHLHLLTYLSFFRLRLCRFETPTALLPGNTIYSHEDQLFFRFWFFESLKGGQHKRIWRWMYVLRNEHLRHSDENLVNSEMLEYVSNAGSRRFICWAGTAGRGDRHGSVLNAPWDVKFKVRGYKILVHADAVRWMQTQMSPGWVGTVEIGVDKAKLKCREVTFIRI